jgi:radical SAM superfamily enzyme YgiQ (UPF0313 family)
VEGEGLKVLFTFFPLSIRYSYACALLSAICRNAGIETKTVPMGEVSVSKFKWYTNLVSEFNPDFICCNYTTRKEYEMAIPYVLELKKLGIPLLAGGVYVRRCGIPHSGFFNYICRGEAEILPDFFLKGDTLVFDAKYRCEDISALPLPDYSCVDGTELQVRSPMFKGKRIIPYSSSRGCVHNCSFCETRFQPRSNEVRIRTTIKKDLEFINNDLKPDLIWILDEQPPYYMEEWREQIEGNQMPIVMYIRADIKPDDLIFLHANGLRYCSFGVESGVEKYRNDVLKKGITDKEIWRTVELLNSLGIEYMSFFIEGAPMEDDWIKMETAKMVARIGGHPVVWKYDDLSVRWV